MIDIRKHIYGILTSDTILTDIVTGGVHIFQDGKDVRDDFEDIWPQITYGRYTGSVTTRVGVRTENYQISAWAKTLEEADNIGNRIVHIFNRRDNDGAVRFTTLDNVADTYDEETKSFGVHVRFAFILYDPTY